MGAPTHHQRDSDADDLEAVDRAIEDEEKLIFSGAKKKMTSGQPGQATMMSGDGLTELEIIAAERILAR
jgi:hypothetical protein